MEITIEEIQKKFESLPEDLKWAIIDANIDDNIIEIGQAENLNVRQMGQLSLETYMEIFGFTKPENLEDSIQKSLELPPEKIRTIVNAINNRILKKIREKMMASSGVKIPEEVSQDLVTNNDTDILNQHGIEIVPEKLELASGIKPTESKEEILRKIERAKIIPVQQTFTQTRTPKTEPKVEIQKNNPMLSQKLAGSLKIPTTQTNHSLPNMQSSSSSSIVGGKKADPYREIPE